MGNTHKRRHTAHALPINEKVFKFIQSHQPFESRNRSVSVPSKIISEDSPKSSFFANRKAASEPIQQEKTFIDNDVLLATLSGWTVKDLEQLRNEFYDYTNQSGEIDQNGFRKLYIASLLNTKWEALENGAEAAFQNFDVNKTGKLDFNDFMVACLNMTTKTAF